MSLTDNGNENGEIQNNANCASRKNEDQNEQLVIKIEESFKSSDFASATKPCICKVPVHLRKVNEKAYTPMVISIGPFHCHNEKLKNMEGHKLRYFKCFIARQNTDLKNLVNTIREKEEEIRSCYAKNTKLNNFDSDDFVTMILQDANFIFELFFVTV